MSNLQTQFFISSSVRLTDFIKMFRVLVAISVFALPSFIMAIDECPYEYRRFSTDHSFCKPPNARCSFISKGIQNKAEIVEILDAHNGFRSKVAMGEEKLAGGLPTASNMLEMSWDEELAQIAQKWAEQCLFQHDCDECRVSKSFSTGQNIAYSEHSCENEKCENKIPDWRGRIEKFYSEVNLFDKEIVSAFPAYKDPKENKIGHFTQIIYAKTWKVGCGYVVYKNNGYARKLYVCNYGPAGNWKGAPIYKEGPPCSDCPKNSCCGDECKGRRKIYPGLCKLSSSPPLYKPKEKPLFFCTFKKRQKCEFESEGMGEWKLSKTNGGTFLSVMLNEKQSSVAHFRQTVNSKRGSCMTIELRKGPTVGGMKDDSKLEVEFEQNGQKKSSAVWSYKTHNFILSPLLVPYGGNIKFSLKFTVPAGAPPQFVEIKQIEITEESCKW